MNKINSISIFVNSSADGINRSEAGFFAPTFLTSEASVQKGWEEEAKSAEEKTKPKRKLGAFKGAEEE